MAKKENIQYPSYYTITPAEVRYCKELRPAEKLLYGEITALSNKLGYCYAKNTYLGELYDVEPTTVSEWINNLEQNGFISITGAKGINRRISLTNILRKKVKVNEEPKEKPEAQPKEKPETNNTSTNTTSTNPEEFSSEDYFKSLVNHKDRKLQIIAIFALKKKKYLEFKDKKSANAFIFSGMVLKQAKDLVGFTDKQILDGMRKASELTYNGSPVNWGLSTILGQIIK